MHRIGWLCGVLLWCVTILGCGGRPPAVVPHRCAGSCREPAGGQGGRRLRGLYRQTRAVADVEVRARVTGYLEKVLFTEGTEVKKGDPLFADRSAPLRGLAPLGTRPAWHKIGQLWTWPRPSSPGPSN